MMPMTLTVLALGAMLLGSSPSPVANPGSPGRFAPYSAGNPCMDVGVDRSYTQFQVNLADEHALLEGRLHAGPRGAALDVGDSGRRIELVTNASMADWLFAYPFLDGVVGVWGRPILQDDCSLRDDTFYVDAIFPAILVQDRIDPALDLMRRDDAPSLRAAALTYGGVLRRAAGVVAAGDGTDHRDEGPGSRVAASILEEEIFSNEAARGHAPWRVSLLGSGEVPPAETSVDILLSGADGSTGFFGHIAVGGGGLIYNVYPKGGDRGAPEAVPIGDYLFNTQRGQALRRPNWILRIGGLPAEMVAALHEEMRRQIEDIQEGRSPYHPTANNCTVASFKALEHLGLGVSSARYFTRRFPRLAFERLLDRLPGMIASGRLPARRVEMIFVPQVPTRVTEGHAPNRPLRERSRLD